MAAKISITPYPDYLSVKVSGNVHSIQEILDYMTEFRDEAARHELRNVLLDYTDAHFDMDYHDMHELAETAVQNDFALCGLRIAVVCRPESLERHSLFETIAINRSVFYQVFTAPHKALARLLASS